MYGEFAMKFTNVDQSSSAILSECGTYRYLLSRAWKYPAEDQPYVLFILLNPSTADHLQNDPTVRRCIGFAKEWGYNRVVIGNLYAYRSTDPKQLNTHLNPVGPKNIHHLKTVILKANKVVLGWGSNAELPNSENYIIQEVLQLIQKPYCLGVTKSGQPRHPLYLKYKTKLIEYSTAKPQLER